MLQQARVTIIILPMQSTMAPPEPKKDDANEAKDPSLDSLIEQGADGPKLAKAKSEKKRDREQQRRNALNEGMDRLTDLIFLIDPQLRVVAESRVTKNSSNKTPSTYQLMSRVELVNSAVATLQRVHQENERTKMAIAQIMSRGMPPSGPSTNNSQSGGATDAAGAPEALLGLGSPPQPTQGGGAASLVRPPAQLPPFASMMGPAFSGGSNLFSPNPMMGYPFMAQAAGLQPSESTQGTGGNAGQVSESSGAKGTETTTKDGTSTVESPGRDTAKATSPSPKKGGSQKKEDSKPSPKKRRRKK